MQALEIEGLTAKAGDAGVLTGLDLALPRGEVHAVMGPNGSGKSTLAHVLSGHPAVTVTGGTVRLFDTDLLALDADERARQGLFLAFQYPAEVPGIRFGDFLAEAARAAGGDGFDPSDHEARVAEALRTLQFDGRLLDRDLNDGFSGGEKKRAEALQMLVLRPRLAVLDEPDSGLDVDALARVAEAVTHLRGGDFSALVITHYTRILEHVRPDRVHVLLGGKIVRSGGPELADELEESGYDPIRASLGSGS